MCHCLFLALDFLQAVVNVRSYRDHVTIYWGFSGLLPVFLVTAHKYPSAQGYVQLIAIIMHYHAAYYGSSWCCHSYIHRMFSNFSCPIYLILANWSYISGPWGPFWATGTHFEPPSVYNMNIGYIYEYRFIVTGIWQEYLLSSKVIGLLWERPLIPTWVNIIISIMSRILAQYCN